MSAIDLFGRTPNSDPAIRAEGVVPLRIGLCVLAIALALGQFHVFSLYQWHRLGELTQVTEHIFDGRTHLRVYQNRLLAPWLVSLIQEARCAMGRPCDYVYALLTYHACAAAAVNLVYALGLSALLPRLFRNRVVRAIVGSAALVVVAGAYLLTLGPWVQVWDYWEVMGIAVLVFFDSDRSRGLGFFILLFLVWLPAKESAALVCAWLALTRSGWSWSVAFDWRHYRQQIRIYALSACFVLVALVFAKSLRDAMWVQSVIPAIGKDMANATFGNLLGLFQNFYVTRDAAAELARGQIYPWLYSIFYYYIIATAFVSLRFLISHRDKSYRDISQAIDFGLFILVLHWIIGSIAEARLYLTLVPLLVVVSLRVLAEAMAREGAPFAAIADSHSRPELQQSRLAASAVPQPGGMRGLSRERGG